MANVSVFAKWRTKFQIRIQPGMALEALVALPKELVNPSMSELTRMGGKTCETAMHPQEGGQERVSVQSYCSRSGRGMVPACAGHGRQATQKTKGAG